MGLELSTDIIILLKTPTIGEGVTPIRVSAIPPAILQLAPGTDVRAEVLGQMLNGRTLLKVAGDVVSMELPQAVAPGSSLRMTFLGGEPRPTFSLSLQQNSATPVAISETGRWLGQITQEDAGESSPAPPLGRMTRLMDGPPTDTTRLAATLREALGSSGLFYESHLAEWAAGERDLASIRNEPQATLARQPDGASTTTLPGGSRTAGAPTTPAGMAQASSTTIPAQGSAPPPAATDAAPQAAPGTPPQQATPAATTPSPPTASSGSAAPVTTETAAGTVPGKPPADGTPPPAGHRTGETATSTGKTGEAEQPETSTAQATAPRTAPPEPAPETLRPGASTPQTQTPPQAARGEAAPVPDAPRQQAPQTEPPPAGAVPPRPAPPAPMPTASGQPATGQSPPPPPSAVPSPPPPAGGPLQSNQQPVTAPPQSESNGVAAASRQPQGPEPLQPGRLQQPLQPNEPVTEESAEVQTHHPKAAPETASGQQTQRAEVADPRAAPIIREQLAALNSGIVTWNGEAWPGQPLQWQVEDREARHQDSSEGRWHSELRVDLPNLGKIVTSLKVRGKELHISFAADTDSTTALLQQEALSLEERLAAAGLNLANMVIRHGKKE